jgi:hypothetical protein
MQPRGCIYFALFSRRQGVYMAVVHMPSERPFEETTCAVCHVALVPEKATAGLFDANNRQVFACISHFSEVEKLILGWADFLASERRRCFEQGEEPAFLIYGGGTQNAWFDS